MNALWTARCEGCREPGELYRTRANPTQFKCATCCPPEDRFHPPDVVEFSNDVDKDSGNPNRHQSYAAAKLRKQIEKRLEVHPGYTTISVSIKDILSIIEYLESNERVRIDGLRRDTAEED